ncbi:hypothetical protein LC593_36680 [Nostoc sp. CHAB 5844]|nr:hypothetical protein [Nostoc sp. CHAB 5844]
MTLVANLPYPIRMKKVELEELFLEDVDFIESNTTYLLLTVDDKKP